MIYFIFYKYFHLLKIISFKREFLLKIHILKNKKFTKVLDWNNKNAHV